MSVKQRMAAGAFIVWHREGGGWSERTYGLAEIELGYRAAVTDDVLTKILARASAATITGHRFIY